MKAPLEASDLLRFWFGAASHDAQATWVMQRQRWFGKDVALDAEIRNRMNPPAAKRMAL